MVEVIWQKLWKILEGMVQGEEDYSNPIFTRGEELELQTMQDVEVLKVHLAANKIHIPNIKCESFLAKKIHIPTKVLNQILEKGIIMPKDIKINALA